ncbi:hypothetical protein [Sorangium cellulosum]|uniref:Uncharacterized protein n=1 Tax=Sorangium cellulosum So0157-2 TaxID=1254432 RepID=S4YFJ9_SORCE|nr:hypothetical protein [Sorangium cellulosum]AGP41663.1 hypothetical protein SCE1572_48555 [Sorangium cellulosum So0157-2]
MRFGLFVANGLVLAGVAWTVGLGPSVQASQLLPARATAGLGELAALEARYAEGRTRESVTALAAAYLDRDQPGLASSALEAAPREVRELPEAAHLSARALLRRGRVRDALAAAEQASAACAAGGCPAWLAAKSERQRAFLEQLAAAGVDDPQVDATAARAAYERSASEVRLVAMR